MIQAALERPARAAGAVLCLDDGTVLGLVTDRTPGRRRPASRQTSLRRHGRRSTTTTAPDGTATLYATPIDYATQVADDIIETGTAHHPWLGVLGDDLDPTAAALLGRSGATLTRVVPDGPGRGRRVAGGRRRPRPRRRADHLDVVARGRPAVAPAGRRRVGHVRPRRSAAGDDGDAHDSRLSLRRTSNATPPAPTSRPPPRPHRGPAPGGAEGEARPGPAAVGVDVGLLVGERGLPPEAAEAVVGDDPRRRRGDDRRRVARRQTEPGPEARQAHREVAPDPQPGRGALQRLHLIGGEPPVGGGVHRPVDRCASRPCPGRRPGRRRGGTARAPLPRCSGCPRWPTASGRATDRSRATDHDAGAHQGARGVAARPPTPRPCSRAGPARPRRGSTGWGAPGRPR